MTTALVATIWCRECGQAADFIAYVTAATGGDLVLSRRNFGYRKNRTVTANLTRILHGGGAAEMPGLCRQHGERALDLELLAATIKKRKSATRPVKVVI